MTQQLVDLERELDAKIISESIAVAVLDNFSLDIGVSLPVRPSSFLFRFQS